MLKKTITYTDYNNMQVTEDLYFNLSQMELTKMEMSVEGGLSTSIQEIVDSNDPKSIMNTFESIVLKAYGKKSDDGRRFIKSQELCDEFVQTEAYNALLTELLTDADSAVAFIEGIVPLNLIKGVPKISSQDAAVSALAPAT